ncbi:hypothetical protein Dimus_000538, partial [Dionaea muscipula]
MGGYRAGRRRVGGCQVGHPRAGVCREGRHRTGDCRAGETTGQGDAGKGVAGQRAAGQGRLSAIARQESQFARQRDRRAGFWLASSRASPGRGLWGSVWPSRGHRVAGQRDRRAEFRPASSIRRKRLKIKG